MYLAAWARAEGAPIVIVGGGIQLHPIERPSAELEAAYVRHSRDVIGALGFAVPIRRDARERAVSASWPMTLGRSGKGAAH